jgi:hypothetical protein
MIDINELRTAITRHGTLILDDDEVIELLDRLEAAESDALEQARLNGMGGEHEAALMAKLEAAEKSDTESIAMYRRARDERDVLRAKIERMEKQEPVCWTTQLALELGSSALGFDACRGNLWGDKGIPLYTLPGAQPEPSVPTGFVWPECPKRRQSHVLFDDGYEEGWAKGVATINNWLYDEKPVEITQQDRAYMDTLRA